MTNVVTLEVVDATFPASQPVVQEAETWKSWQVESSTLDALDASKRLVRFARLDESVDGKVPDDPAATSALEAVIDALVAGDIGAEITMPTGVSVRSDRLIRGGAHGWTAFWRGHFDRDGD